MSAPGCGLRQASPNRKEFDFDDTLAYAQRGDVPWQMTLVVKAAKTSKSWYCSATLVAPDHVVCQAYCLYYKTPNDIDASDIKVIAGEMNPYTTTNLTKNVNFFSVADVRFHATEDLAIVRLNKKLPRSVANSICLPENDQADHGPGKVSGWPQYVLNFLVVGTGVAFPYDHCTGLGNGEPNLMCIVNKGPPDCGLDNGSPFFRVPRAGGPAVFVGMKLADEKCRASDNQLSTQKYLRMSKFTKWIADQVGFCGRSVADMDEDNE
jgi:hypothetical protein